MNMSGSLRPIDFKRAPNVFACLSNYVAADIRRPTNNGLLSGEKINEALPSTTRRRRRDKKPHDRLAVGRFKFNKSSHCHRLCLVQRLWPVVVLLSESKTFTRTTIGSDRTVKSRLIKMANCRRRSPAANRSSSSCFLPKRIVQLMQRLSFGG